MKFKMQKTFITLYTLERKQNMARGISTAKLAPLIVILILQFSGPISVANYMQYGLTHPSHVSEVKHSSK